VTLFRRSRLNSLFGQLFQISLSRGDQWAECNEERWCTPAVHPDTSRADGRPGVISWLHLLFTADQPPVDRRIHSSGMRGSLYANSHDNDNATWPEQAGLLMMTKTNHHICLLTSVIATYRKTSCETFITGTHDVPGYNSYASLNNYWCNNNTTP